MGIARTVTKGRITYVEELNECDLVISRKYVNGKLKRYLFEVLEIRVSKEPAMVVPNPATVFQVVPDESAPYRFRLERQHSGFPEEFRLEHTTKANSLYHIEYAQQPTI